jgi:hypothetical protein
MDVLLASPGIRGARLIVLRHGGEIDPVRQLIDSKSVDSQYSSREHNGAPLWKYHAHLQLADM